MKRTFEQFIYEAVSLDLSDAERIPPFKFGNHTIPQGTMFEPDKFKLYKVPFDISKLSPITAKNIKKLQEDHGFTFDGIMYVATVDRGSKTKWSEARRKYVKLNIPDIGYSFYIPGKNYEGEDIMYARIETLNKSAGQTKLFYKSGKKAIQANRLEAPWELRMKVAKDRGDMNKEFEVGSEVL